MKFLSVEAFAAQRRTDQDDLEKTLFPIVAEAVKAYPVQGWYDELLRDVSRLYADTYHREGGSGTPNEVDTFVKDVRDTLEKTDEPDDNTVDRLSIWLATAILNAATMEAAGDDEEFVVMEWVTMHDEDVRAAHVDTEGQQRPPGEAFDVAGVEMRYPGDPTAPIELWINCRCSLAPLMADQVDQFAAVVTAWTSGHDVQEREEEPMDETTEAPVGPLPWHGVLAPEGVYSGDGRMFNEGALTHRDLPLPLTWQKASSNGHDGSVTVAKIEQVARVDNQLRATGHWLSIPEADEVIGLVAEFGKFGVSVDADDAEFGYDDSTGKVAFSKARIASASIVAIPAFAEAFVALGDAPPDFLPADEKEEECDPNSPDYEECLAKKDETGEPEMALVEAVSEESWDGSASRFTDEQWKASCVLHLADTLNKSDHKLPIKEPGGALSRAGVHAAASRFNQVDAPAEAKSRAKASLRGAYKQLGEEPPDVLKAAAVVDTFDRGAGWITDPVATKRIHDYWTKPGQEGYLKIGWGKGGDFNRCRVLVGEKIAANSPEDLVHLNEICARWHHDALGIWPGEHVAAADADQFTEIAPALSLVASGGACAPSEWFQNPNFTELAPLTVTDEGRVFGHLAGWTTCHTAYKDTCVAPPRSQTDYAYFLTGYVQTEDGPVRTGPLTIGTGHAGPGGMRGALSHYDNTGSAVADVTCGDDDIGIWFAGWLRPGVTDEQVAALRASPLSGDWRRVRPFDDELELIAALAVNSGGFPIPRVGVENGQQVSLVAAGVVEPVESAEHFADTLAAMVEKRIAERQARREKMAALAARVKGESVGV